MILTSLYLLLPNFANSYLHDYFSLCPPRLKLTDVQSGTRVVVTQGDDDGPEPPPPAIPLPSAPPIPPPFLPHSPTPPLLNPSPQHTSLRRILVEKLELCCQGRGRWSLIPKILKAAVEPPLTVLVLVLVFGSIGSFWKHRQYLEVHHLEA